MYWNKPYLLLCLIVLVAGLVTACDSQQQAASVQPPQAIGKGDECHLCGMLIQNFPGPKGQVYLRGQKNTAKFCSTRDMFAFILQPDSQAIVQSLYVHDMGATDWRHPDYSPQHFVDARKAYYVIGHSRKGAMGHTLASFAKQQAAEKFAQEYGGKVLRFDDITLEVLNRMGE